jgi:hypothetical protein
VNNRIATHKARVLWMALGILLVTCWAGCSSKAPDFEGLKGDLEKQLENDRGKTSKGNADVYKIVGLTIVNRTATGKTGFTIDFEGEVECLKGFYMSGDGEYSVAKPAWQAKRHVTEGTRIPFAGRAEYESTGKGWQMRNYSTKMGLAYAPVV